MRENWLRMGILRRHYRCCRLYSVVYGHKVLGLHFSAHNDCFHRTIEYFGLEGPFKGQVVQAPVMSRDIFNFIRLLRAPMLCC